MQKTFKSCVYNLWLPQSSNMEYVCTVWNWEKETPITHQHIKNIWTEHKQPTQPRIFMWKKSLSKRGLGQVCLQNVQIQIMKATSNCFVQVWSLKWCSPIAFDERVTLWLQRVGSQPCACAYIALFAHKLAYNHYAIARALIAANTCTQGREWLGALEPKQYSPVKGNLTVVDYAILHRHFEYDWLSTAFSLQLPAHAYHEPHNKGSIRSLRGLPIARRASNWQAPLLSRKKKYGSPFGTAGTDLSFVFKLILSEFASTLCSPVPN